MYCELMFSFSPSLSSSYPSSSYHFHFPAFILTQSPHTPSSLSSLSRSHPFPRHNAVVYN